MARLIKRERIGVGIQTAQTIGSYVAPTNGTTIELTTGTMADYIFAEGVEVTLSPENISRNYNRNSFSGGVRDVLGKKTVSVKFKTELLYTTAAVTEVGVMKTLFEACAYIHGTNTYTPLSTNYSGFPSPAKACSLVVNKDGYAHKIENCIGTGRISLESGKIGMIEFDFSGTVNGSVFSTSETIASIVPNYINNVSGVSNFVVKSSSFSFDSVSNYTVSKIEIDLGNKISLRDDMSGADGVIGFYLTGREPSMTVSLEAPTTNYWVDKHEALFAAAAIVTTPGYVFNMADAQVISAPYTDLDGVLGHEVGFKLCETSAGDNALTITEDFA